MKHTRKKQSERTRQNKSHGRSCQECRNGQICAWCSNSYRRKIFRAGGLIARKAKGLLA